jgi:membrane protease YdiL (CAAX protease family)
MGGCAQAFRPGFSTCQIISMNTLDEWRAAWSHQINALRCLWGMSLVFCFAAWFITLLIASIRFELRLRSRFAATIAGNILVWTPLIDHLFMLLVFWALAVGFKRSDYHANLPLSSREFRWGRCFTKSPIVLLLGSVITGLLVSGSSYLLWYLVGSKEDGFWNELAACRVCLWAYVLEAILIAPLVEEIIFRGLLFHAIERAIGKWRAVILSALAFLGIHLIQSQGRLTLIFGYLLFGVVAGLMRSWTGSLWPGWVAHVTNNLIVGVSLLRH